MEGLFEASRRRRELSEATKATDDLLHRLGRLGITAQSLDDVDGANMSARSSTPRICRSWGDAWELIDNKEAVPTSTRRESNTATPF